MINTNSYQAKQFNLSGLNGISDRTLEMHFKLYEGYVKETNKLTEKISEFLSDGKVDQEEVPATVVGRAFLQAVDSSGLGAVTREAGKRIFTRARPAQTASMAVPGSPFLKIVSPAAKVCLVAKALMRLR